MSVYYIGSIPCSGGDIYHYGRKGMKWGKNIFGKISEFFTGNNARRELASATAQRNGSRQQARALQGTSIGNAASNKLGWSHTYNGKNIKAIYGTGDEQRMAVAQENYNRTLPGMAEKAREQAAQAMAKARQQVSNAYSQAAEKLGGKGLDIQSFYSQVMQKAQGAINRGKSMVSKYGSQFVSQIETAGKNALAGGKSFLEGIMKKKESTPNKNKDLDPSPRTIVEKRITETRIPEKRITETRIPEKRITETRIPEKRISENGTKTNKSNKLNKSVKTNYDPNGPKPSNVSDEYWREYVYNTQKNVYPGQKAKKKK